MFDCCCYDENNNVLEHFWQFDIGRKIGVEIVGYTGSNSITVQFSTKYTENTISVVGTMSNGIINANVPDIIFSNNGILDIYVCENNRNYEKTIAHTQLPIRKRKKPEKYMPSQPDTPSDPCITQDIATVSETKEFLGIFI